MAKTKRTGNIDSRRITTDGIEGWPYVPAILVPGNMQAYGIYDDFFKECNLAAGRTQNGWRLRQTNGTFSIADEAGGVGLMQTAGGDDEVCQITLGGDAAGAFFPQAGRDIYYEVRTKCDINGTNTANLAFGLINPAAADYLQDAGAGISQADYMCWETLFTGAGVSEWSFTGASTGGGVDRNDLDIALVSLTFHTFGFWVHGVTNIYPFYDRVYQPDGLIAAANITALGLMPFFAIRSGEATVEPLYFDYCMCVQDR